jgi:hypothetical protein
MPVGDTVFFFSLPASVGGVFQFFGLVPFTTPQFYEDFVNGVFTLTLQRLT